MFHGWGLMPREIRKIFIDKMTPKNKFMMAGCSKPTFDEVLDSFDFIYTIRVFPQDLIESSLLASASPGYEIFLQDDGDFDVCYLEVIKKDETSSIVKYSLDELKTNCLPLRENYVIKTEWEAEVDGSYENITAYYLKTLLNKSKNVLKELTIQEPGSTVTELPFNTFHIPSLSKLEDLSVHSKSYDLIQCGFTNLQQIRDVAISVSLANTSLQLDEMLVGKFSFLGIDQLNLTSLDILEYLERLRNPENTGALIIDLVDKEKPNFIDIDIKPHIERVLRGFSLRSMRSEWNDDGFEIQTVHEGFKITVQLKVEESLLIQSTRSTYQFGGVWNFEYENNEY